MPESERKKLSEACKGHNILEVYGRIGTQAKKECPARWAQQGRNNSSNCSLMDATIHSKYSLMDATIHSKYSLMDETIHSKYSLLMDATIHS
eukprot:784640-Prorocentrum_minimum.AAC.1